MAKIHIIMSRTGPARGLAPVALTCLLMTGPATEPVSALELEGYTEPYRTIEVAADEMGVVDEMLVHEGEVVEIGEPLARLNSDVHLGLLAVAEQGVKSEGRLDAALAELKLRQDRLEKLQTLRAEGHARQEEVDLAAAEVAVADANVRTAREDRMTKTLEWERIKTQIDRRTVRAPISGVVTRLHRDQGEFVAPTSPELLTLVQIDILLANFTIASMDASKLQQGENVDVRFQNGAQAAGTVDFVAPVADAESSTVLVKVRVPNFGGRFRSGERCRMVIKD
jgi:RND family efflux transporter MFP subunit